MEDDHWAERGEFDRQQDMWKMTAGWGRGKVGHQVGWRITAGQREQFDPQQCESVTALKQVSRAEHLWHMTRNNTEAVKSVEKTLP